ncbi:ParB/RepB/Spo0J family partition protein [Nocardia tengchongensis]|uniref:ParB/RepB/Spo0J family partition protein n=1 Tax=Nocardia tengchongensis TaxID=2055889 RepID=UPI00366932AA
MAQSAGLIDEARKQAAAMTAAEVASLPRLPLSAFGGYPYNPEHRSYDKDELQPLADTIKLHGVLAPVIVADRAEVIRLDPSIEALLDELDRQAAERKEIEPGTHPAVIFIDGHRRHGASRLAGVPDLPYMVRNDLADPATLAEIFLSTSINALRLTPIEEAKGYERVMRLRGVNQTKAGALVGSTQSTVSKSVKLLQLPEVVQDAVHKGYLSPHASRQLLALPEDDREGVYLEAIASLAEEDRASQESTAVALRSAINRANLEAEKAVAVADARKTLKAAGIAEIDPTERFGAEVWRHLLQDNEVDSVRAAGELAGALVEPTGRITYYSEPPAPRHRAAADETAQQEPEYSNGISDGAAAADPEDYSNGISGEPAPADEELEPELPAPTTAPVTAEAVEKALIAATASHHERVAAMRQVVANCDAATVVDVTADAILAMEWLDDFDAAELFTAEVGLETTRLAIESVLLTGSRADVHRMALARALGALEAEAARKKYATNGPWPLVIQRHVRRLVTLGVYSLTDYDKALLSGTE